jgi:hypothetical protein
MEISVSSVPVTANQPNIGLAIINADGINTIAPISTFFTPRRFGAAYGLDAPRLSAAVQLAIPQEPRAGFLDQR